MTKRDKKTIKAFELCITNGVLKQNCDVCPYKQKDAMCMDDLMKEALHLIKRLQTECEKLQNTLDDVLDRQPILVARAEKYAVEEFAEQLNQMAQWLPLTAIPDRFVTVSNINKLVKERTGEE